MSIRMKKFWSYWDRFGIFGILLVAIIIFGLLNPRIVSADNLLTVLSRSATTGIAAAGMTFAICAGGFDLSVGSVLSLSTCVVAMNINNGMGMWPSILLALVVGAMCGLVNGLIITKLNIQTFVATLATQLAFKGIALVYSGGNRIMMTGNKDIKIFATGEVFGISAQIIILIAVFVAAYYIYKRTSFGVHTRAVGSNNSAAVASGIKRDRTLILVFVMTALMASIAGILQSSRLASGSAVLGDGFETDVIASVILGGTALSGGRGNLWGTLAGAVLLTLIRSGLNILGVGEALQKLTIAAVLLFALSVSGIKLITQERAS